jgi:hypothetical protein
LELRQQYLDIQGTEAGPHVRFENLMAGEVGYGVVGKTQAIAAMTKVSSMCTSRPREQGLFTELNRELVDGLMKIDLDITCIYLGNPHGQKLLQTHLIPTIAASAVNSVYLDFVSCFNQ